MLEFSDVVHLDKELVAVSFLELVEMMRLGRLELDLPCARSHAPSSGKVTRRVAFP